VQLQKDLPIVAPIPDASSLASSELPPPLGRAIHQTGCGLGANQVAFPLGVAPGFLCLYV
jgi:hypothetical protein